MTPMLPPKKEVALALLERSNVDVYLDPRAKGVVVPPQYRKEPRLILKIGLNMPVPIPDLRLDDESMSCTLSFNRSPFYCVVPWPSVFAMVGDDGRGMVWPDDVPQELAVRVVDERRAPGDRESASALAPAPAPSSGSGGSAGSKKGRVRAAPPPAESKPDVSGDRPAARGRPKKKKKDERERPERPTLMAVPPAPPSARDIGEAREARDAREGTPAQRPVPAAQQRKAKRELPPYLRVVK